MHGFWYRVSLLIYSIIYRVSPSKPINPCRVVFGLRVKRVDVKHIYILRSSELKSKRISVSKVSIPTGRYIDSSNPRVHWPWYMEDGYLARVHLHRYNPGKRNIFRFRGSRRSVSPRCGGRIRTKIGTKLVLGEVADREKWRREMERERNIYIRI